jgi:hypothetical protein
MSTWDVKADRVIYISYISHFVVRVQLADLNWWVILIWVLVVYTCHYQPLSHLATEFWPIRIEKDTFHMLIWIIYSTKVCHRDKKTTVEGRVHIIYCTVCICSDPYAKFSRWPTGQPIGKAVDLLVYRLTYWPTGRFGVWVNLLAKWSIGVPSSQCYFLPQNY